MAQTIIPEIETERLVFRLATAERLNDWAAIIFADEDVMRYLPPRDMTPYARAERALNNYNRNWTEHKLGGWVITDKQSGDLIGHCHFNYLDETDEYELGYSLGKAYWGRGLATEAARAATRYGFESRGLERIMALTFPENAASRRVLEHVGFVYERIAQYHGGDVAYYSLTRDMFRTDGSVYRVRLDGDS